MIELYNLPISLNSDKIKDTLYSASKAHKVSIDKLTFSFVKDHQMLILNKRFLNHNTYTDIITFSYESKPYILAEVFISIDQCIQNAKKFSQSIDNETLRLISHGFLHAIGFSDKSTSEIHSMRKEENKIIKMFHVKQLLND
ncbi:MAG: rRNA maturation RNase YbeY [Flavobacteriaceae bacterium]|nr:rRNA maturation RNase YbeY [Flavobacteriaceae bacterium]|tara:strand:- start:32688 stop:33113 length:426 start_codon:yes stop_codon:yes gene_type:complete